MKNHRNHKNNGNGEKSESVHLEFSHPTAQAVAVAGTFNDWRPEATPMVSLGDGRWIKDLTLPPGTYEYLFVADGQWMRDPLAVETAPNPFGGENSILRMTDTTKSMEVRSAIPAEGQRVKGGSAHRQQDCLIVKHAYNRIRIDGML